MELKNSITGIVNSLHGFNSSVEMTEDTINEYKDRAKTIQPIQNNREQIDWGAQRKKKKKEEEEKQSLADLWDNKERSNICII